MLTKNEIKDIQSLYHKKSRDEAKLFVAEGPKMASELLNSSFKIQCIYATRQWLHAQSALQAPSKEISEEELKKISAAQTPNQVVVIAQQAEPLNKVNLKGRITLVLDGIQDPGNMGTILRTADWFGVNNIICSNDCVDMYNPKVVQATMGSITRINCVYNDLTNNWTYDSNIPLFGALLYGTDVFSLKAVNEAMLVIGNEGKGIREPLLSRITHPVTIPRAGTAESLNAAVATGILLGCMVFKR